MGLWDDDVTKLTAERNHIRAVLSRINAGNHTTLVSIEVDQLKVRLSDLNARIARAQKPKPSGPRGWR